MQRQRDGTVGKKRMRVNQIHAVQIDALFNGRHAAPGLAGKEDRVALLHRQRAIGFHALRLVLAQVLSALFRHEDKLFKVLVFERFKHLREDRAARQIAADMQNHAFIPPSFAFFSFSALRNLGRLAMPTSEP